MSGSDRPPQLPNESAARNPSLKLWLAVGTGARMADLTRREPAAKLPPRTTPISQCPGRTNADPSVGISAAVGVQQSSTHSQALPCMSNSPHGLGLRLPTGSGP